LRFDVLDGVGEGIGFDRELLEGHDEGTVAHPLVVSLRPAQHSTEGATLLEPALRNPLSRLVAGDEDAILSRGVCEKNLVVGALREHIDGANDIPASVSQTLDDLLTDMVVREEREPGHYRW
jgi:hypothetical protein